MKVVIIGTGASIGTIGAEAGVAKFVRRLIEVRGLSWRSDFPNLALAIDDCKDDYTDLLSLGLDNIWSRIDYYSKFRGILGVEYGPETSLELYKAILEAYSFTMEVDQLSSVTTGNFTLKQILAELKPGDVLISFNWDVLAETVAKKILGKDLVQAPCPGGERHILLIKPHGSLSWEHKPDSSGGCDLVFRDGIGPRLKVLKPTDVDPGDSQHFTQPLLLGAVPIKSEILEEIQRGHDPAYRTICSQWREVVSALARTNELVVAGYRFPPEDLYGRFLFREAARKRAAGTAPPIMYYALNEDRSDIEDAFRDIFGKSVNYTYMGKVEPAFQEGS